MKPYLVDVPVKINIWTRLDCQKKQFDVIRQARPSILFIQSDGGRSEAEWDKIRQNRKMIDEGIDWECEVYRLYEENNNGLYTMGFKTRKLIWSTVDRCIFLEDDDIPSVSFFQFCAELLEKYKNDQRIECICGFNTLETWDKCNSDYFFSKRGSIWGIATWKRVVEEFYDFSYANDPYIMGLLQQQTRKYSSLWKKIQKYSKSDTCSGHVAGSEFYIDFSIHSQNRLQIIPKYNLISNVGATNDAEHSDSINQLPRGLRKIYNSRLYEYEFPLKHPKYVISDIEYEDKRNRVMGHYHPLIKLWRDIERTFYKIISGDIKYIIIKLKKRLFEHLGKTTEH